MGNLAVHTGAHRTVLPLCRAAAASGSVRALHDSKQDLGAPTQLRLRVGDAVLCHHKLPHLGARPRGVSSTRVERRPKAYSTFPRRASSGG